MIALGLSVQAREAHVVLGVSPSAGHEEVKVAYRKLAKLYHSDVNSSPEALAKMQEVNAAYDEFKRRWTGRPVQDEAAKDDTHLTASEKFQAFVIDRARKAFVQTHRDHFLTFLLTFYHFDGTPIRFVEMTQLAKLNIPLAERQAMDDSYRALYTNMVSFFALGGTGVNEFFGQTLGSGLGRYLETILGAGKHLPYQVHFLQLFVQIRNLCPLNPEVCVGDFADHALKIDAALFRNLSDTTRAVLLKFIDDNLLGRPTGQNIHVLRERLKPPTLRDQLKSCVESLMGSISK